MVISGNLKESPFQTLIGHFQDRTGVLELWNVPGLKDCKLWVKRGHLRCIEVGKEYVADPLKARDILLEIIAAREGAFELTYKEFKTPCDPALHWPLERVVTSLSLIEEDITLRTIELPPPDVTYLISGDESLLDLNNSFFWKRAKPLLQHGATAEQIAEALGISLKLACYYLARLEWLGAVKPAADAIEIEF
ncbi:hypothetical protein [Calidithermus timidus]|jgi:hypothetical protein|uniref:hypothetical protein n=1 Tax=Calidithermus timidus TaxID=307124 RepID=UPI00037E0989|nr:hypothetical protein [Calidithermus timidus]